MKKLPLTLWHHFFTELAWLLHHGIPLQSAFHILLKQDRLRPLHRLCFHCLQHIGAGYPLSSALNISPQYVHFQVFIVCGEAGGALDMSLTRCAGWLQQILHFRQQCRALLFYPTLLVCLLLAGSTLLMTIIVPEFYALYQSFHAPMPLAMTWLWHMHLFLKTWGLYILLGALGGCALLGYASHERLLFRFRITQDVLHAHECAHLGQLLTGGIPVFQAFQHVIRHTQFALQAKRLTRILAHITEGHGLAQAYQHVGSYDPYLCDMLRIAEQTGTLDETYLKLSDYYTHQLDNRIQRIKQEWQPLFMLAMGLLIGSWVFLLYYPLIQLGYAMG